MKKSLPLNKVVFKSKFRAGHLHVAFALMVLLARMVNQRTLSFIPIQTKWWCPCPSIINWRGFGIGAAADIVSFSSNERS